MIDLVLRPSVILHAIVEVDLLKLVSVRERTTADVDLVLGILFHSEDQGLPRVLEDAADLVKKNYVYNYLVFELVFSEFVEDRFVVNITVYNCVLNTSNYKLNKLSLIIPISGLFLGYYTISEGPCAIWAFWIIFGILKATKRPC